MGVEIICVILALQKKEKLVRRRLLKSLRDSSNPFEMQESIFIKLYRIPKALCRQIFEEIRPYDDMKTSIPLLLRFLAALYFYAHGSYQKCVSANHATGMSQSSLSRVLHHMTRTIINSKASVVHFSTTEMDRREIKAGFFRSWGIKWAVGVIDCTHVAIIAPTSTNAAVPLNLYMNRKGFYSMNVEAVCDHRLLFTAINAQFPGSCHDSGIWTTSTVRAAMTQAHSLQRDSWLLGDQGYPLEPWLMTPVAEAVTPKEQKYNKMHGSTRNVIERAFGVLKSCFRCISKHRVLHYSHKRAANIVYACAILHNILVMNGVENTEINEYPDEDTHTYSADIARTSREGERVRNRYILTL